jgi:hypothetical protein
MLQLLSLMLLISFKSFPLANSNYLLHRNKQVANLHYQHIPIQTESQGQRGYETQLLCDLVLSAMLHRNNLMGFEWESAQSSP